VGEFSPSSRYLLGVESYCADKFPSCRALQRGHFQQGIMSSERAKFQKVRIQYVTMKVQCIVSAFMLVQCFIVEPQISRPVCVALPKGSHPQTVFLCFLSPLFAGKIRFLLLKYSAKLLKALFRFRLFQRMADCKLLEKGYYRQGPGFGVVF
jgi:hypothetical protein